jgi:hypothetical protein
VCQLITVALNAYFIESDSSNNALALNKINNTENADNTVFQEAPDLEENQYNSAYVRAVSMFKPTAQKEPIQTFLIASNMTLVIESESDINIFTAFAKKHPKNVYSLRIHQYYTNVYNNNLFSYINVLTCHTLNMK